MENKALYRRKHWNESFQAVLGFDSVKIEALIEGGKNLIT